VQNNRRKLPLYYWEILLLLVVTPIIYLESVMLIFGKEYNLPWRMISERLSVMLVLGFDVMWVGLMILRPLKSTRAKVLLTLLVFTLSAVILTDLYLIYTWHKMW
jgi:hypothetical protein